MTTTIYIFDKVPMKTPIRVYEDAEFLDIAPTGTLFFKTSAGVNIHTNNPFRIEVKQ